VCDSSRFNETRLAKMPSRVAAGKKKRRKKTQEELAIEKIKKKYSGRILPRRFRGSDGKIEIAAVLKYTEELQKVSPSPSPSPSPPPPPPPLPKDSILRTGDLYQCCGSWNKLLRLPEGFRPMGEIRQGKKKTPWWN
jgi:hypothetical protein